MDKSGDALALGTRRRVDPRLTSIALEMALPALGGFWLDRWLGTRGLFLIVGALLGIAVGMLHLLRLSKTGNGRPV